MLERIVDAAARHLLAEEREALAGLQQTLAALGVSVEDESALERSVRQLDQLFLLVVIGEFNAGKSAFINALAGARLLEEGVSPRPPASRSSRTAPPGPAPPSKPAWTW